MQKNNDKSIGGVIKTGMALYVLYVLVVLFILYKSLPYIADGLGSVAKIKSGV